MHFSAFTALSNKQSPTEHYKSWVKEKNQIWSGFLNGICKAGGSVYDMEEIYVPSNTQTWQEAGKYTRNIVLIILSCANLAKYIWKCGSRLSFSKSCDYLTESLLFSCYKLWNGFSFKSVTSILYQNPLKHNLWNTHIFVLPNDFLIYCNSLYFSEGLSDEILSLMKAFMNVDYFKKIPSHSYNTILYILHSLNVTPT